MTPRAVSLFSGCGGSDLGIQEAGFDVVLANDIWGPAIDLYRRNLPSVDTRLGDIREIREFPQADLLVGCYPCQGYSQGGKRNPESPQNFLYREFDRALREIKPKAFVVENVAGMAYGNNRKLLRNQLIRFRMAGFLVDFKILDAKDYGVPQTRRRLFIVGVNSSFSTRFKFPQPTHGPGREFPFKTQKDAIWGMDHWPKGQYCTEPLHWYYLSRRRRHDWSEPSPCIVGHWRHVPLHPLSPPLVRIDTDHWRFKFNGPTRRLSLAECATLQSFPDTYDWSGVRVRDGFLAAGNAVPPQLAKLIVSHLPNVW